MPQEHSQVPYAAPALTRKPVEAQSRSPFAHVEAAFARLTAHPDPLALTVDGRAVTVAELAFRGVLPGRGAAAAPGLVGWSDRVWAAVLEQSRAGDEAWTVVAAGLALPGFRRIVRRLGRLAARDQEDVEQEILTAFLVAARTVDAAHPQIARRLLRAADRAGHGWAYRAQVRAEREFPLSDAGRGTPASPADGADAVLRRAVRAGVLEAGEAELVAVTRLDGGNCAAVAAQTGDSARQVQRRRQAAERKLLRALRDGVL